MSELERITAKKRAVRAALESCRGFVTAAQLHERINDVGPPIGLATVYRQLNALVDAQVADSVMHPSGQLYRLCEHPETHHHHLICDDCGRAADIEPPDETWMRDAAARAGFTVTRHSVELYGLCDDCRTR